MSSAVRELEELYKLLEELRQRIRAVEAVSREVAEALALIVRLQEGVLSILKRILGKLDEHSQKLNTLVRDVSDLKVRVGRLEERMDRIEKDMKALKEDVNALKKDVSVLKEGVSALKKDVNTLKRDVSELKRDVSVLKKDMRDVKVTLSRIAGELEEEARDAVPYMLERTIGMRVELEKLAVEGIVEVNLYGVADDLCVLGEVRTRIGPSVIKKLCRSLLTLYEERRDLLRDRVVLVAYGLDVLDIMRDLIGGCGIGILTPRGIVFKPRVMRLKEAVETCRRVLERLK